MSMIQNNYNQPNIPTSPDISTQDIKEDFKVFSFMAGAPAPTPEPEGANKPEKKEPAPDAPPTSASPQALSGFGNFLSPGAMLAILCVKEAAQENESATKQLLSHGETVQKSLEKQADNIMKGAVAQFVCTVLSAVGSMAMTGVAGAKTMKLDANLQGVAANQAMVGPNNWGAGAKFTEQVGNSVGGLVNSVYQSYNKELDATVENARTMMDGLRNHMQMQRDMANKALDFYSSMQANMNQTRAKILV